MGLTHGKDVASLFPDRAVPSPCWTFKARELRQKSGKGLNLQIAEARSNPAGVTCCRAGEGRKHPVQWLQHCLVVVVPVLTPYM